MNYRTKQITTQITIESMWYMLRKWNKNASQHGTDLCIIYANYVQWDRNNKREKDKEDKFQDQSNGKENTTKTIANETRHFVYNDNNAVLRSESKALFCFI